MNKQVKKRDTLAVSEVLGGLLLVLIAILAFTAIYNIVFPLPNPEVNTNVKLQGYVNTNNLIIIEHIGGEELCSYCIDVKYINNTLIETIIPDGDFEILDIGDQPYILPTKIKLNDSDDKVKIIIRKIDETQEIIFEGILQGRSFDLVTTNDSNSPYLISSLLTDTTDEDLICFNKTSSGEPMNVSFLSTNNAFNWFVDGSSLTNILYTFDVNDSFLVSDLSTNNYIGTNQGVSWTDSGKKNGAYAFNGDDYIILPYCFSASSIGAITIEVWIKTGENEGAIISFNRSDYFTLALSGGNVKWSITSDDQTADLVSLSNIADNMWHHIAVTYDQSTAESAIYIDGILDSSSSDFDVGDLLGSGSRTLGYIGKERAIYSMSGPQIIFTDNFETDKGWTIIDNVNDGEWERGTPIGGGDRGDPPTDYDSSGQCYLTDNEDGNSDVDDGETFLISPKLDLSSYQNVTLNCAIWYTNNYGSNDNRDYFYVSVSNDNGSMWHTAQTIGPDTPEPVQWYEYSLDIEDYIALTNQVKIRFEVSDVDGGSVVEAGVDSINITGIPISGVANFSGTIDELKIYKRALSQEQIYQNYLVDFNEKNDISVIVSEETVTGQTWSCLVTPTNNNMYASSEYSNQLIITPYGGG